MKRAPPGATSSHGKPPKDGQEVEAPIEEVLNLGPVAIGVLLEAEGTVGARQRGLDVAQQVLIARNAGWDALAAPPPVTCRSRTMPATGTAVKQLSPSETSVTGKTQGDAQTKGSLHVSVLLVGSCGDDRSVRRSSTSLAFPEPGAAMLAA